MAMNGLPAAEQALNPQPTQSTSARGANNYVAVQHSRAQDFGQRDQLAGAHYRAASSSVVHQHDNNNHQQHHKQSTAPIDFCASSCNPQQQQRRQQAKLTCNSNINTQVHDKQINLHYRANVDTRPAQSPASKQEPDQYASQLRNHNLNATTMQAWRPAPSSSQAARPQQPLPPVQAQQQVRKGANNQQPHVNFNRSNNNHTTSSNNQDDEQDEPGEGRKKKYLTAKYGQQQMNLIKKRLKIEMWLYEQLQELAKGTKTEVSLFELAKPELFGSPLRSNDN